MLKARMFSDYDEALQRRKEVNWVGLGYVRFRHERDCISVMEPEPDIVYKNLENMFEVEKERISWRLRLIWRLNCGPLLIVRCCKK